MWAPIHLRYAIAQLIARQKHAWSCVTVHKTLQQIIVLHINLSQWYWIKWMLYKINKIIICYIISFYLIHSPIKNGVFVSDKLCLDTASSAWKVGQVDLNIQINGISTAEARKGQCCTYTVVVLLRSLDWALTLRKSYYSCLWEDIWD